MNSPNTTRIRLGVLAFPISGLVFASSALVPGIGINPSTDPSGFARAASSVSLANLAGLLTLPLLLYGFQALYAFLAGTRVDRLAFTGMLLSIAGIALFVPFLGIFVFAAPVAARLYLNGQTQSISIISEATNPSNPVALAVGGLSILFYVLGSITFSMAMWRSAKLPRWAAIAYTISTLLSIIPHYVPALWFTGGILLLAAGTPIVRETWKIKNYTKSLPI